MTEQQTVEDLLARLERERLDADRRYNAALTELDRALHAAPTVPDAPRAYDPSRLPEVNAAWQTLPTGTPAFDSSLKGRIGRLVWRLVGPALEQQQQFNSAVADHLNRNVAAHQEAHASLAALLDVMRHELDARVRFESLLVQHLQTITAYVDSKDRALGGDEIRQRLALTEQRLLALKRDVDARREAALPQEAAAGTPGSPGPSRATADTQGSPSRGSAATSGVFTGAVDSLTYVAFEDQFRGASSEIRRRVQDYVPIFAGTSQVVDIGCGRGELLQALTDSGVSVRGLDVNPAMVELCRGRGFDVELGDAVSFLAGQPDASLGGLVAIQVVEHFTPEYLTRFLEAAFHAMRPGAPLVLETINPNCWMAFFETYIRDLTHKQPLHPDTLRHLVASSGFSHVDVQFRSPVSDDDRLARIDRPDGALSDSVQPVVDALNDHAQKLNRRLFSSMDYVVIARR